MIPTEKRVKRDGIERAQDIAIVDGHAEHEQGVTDEARLRDGAHVQPVLALGLGVGGRGRIQLDGEPGWAQRVLADSRAVTSARAAGPDQSWRPTPRPTRRPSRSTRYTVG